MKTSKRRTWTITALLFLGASAPGSVRSAAFGPMLASTGSYGTPLANAASFHATISADGRFTAFESLATNLVAGDTNASQDVFVRDRLLGKVERASVGAGGAQAAGDSQEPAISAEGRFLAFSSAAAGLVANDTNGDPDVFVRDRLLSTTERISVDSAGSQANAVSMSPSISADGRFVMFVSEATNLVPGDTNSSQDVFVRDRMLGTTERVSLNTVGGQAAGDSFGPSVSADGRFVAFSSVATTLVPGDTNGEQDVFVRDRLLGATERVNLDVNGSQAVGNSSADPTISADGRFVAFESDATNLVPGDTNGELDLFMRDRLLGITERVNIGSDGAEAVDGGSFAPSISADGRFVSFDSDSPTLVPGDLNLANDVFVRDRFLRTTERVNVDAAGAEATGGFSGSPSISADGRLVAFESSATSLIWGDTNAVGDVYLILRQPGTDNVPPVAIPAGLQLAVPHDGDPGTQVASYVLDGTHSFDPDGMLLFHRWLRIDGTEFAIGPTAFDAAVPGKHTRILEVMDVYGARSWTPVSIRVLPEPNQGPTGEAGQDQSVADGGGDSTAVNLSGAGSTDPEGDTLTYTWREDGTQIATGISPTVNLEPGRHLIELTVSDPYGASSTDSATVLVGVVDVTALMSVRKLVPTAGPGVNKSTGRVRVTNRSGAGLPGPVSLVLDGLTAIKVNNETGVTTEATGAARKPYLDSTAILRGVTREYVLSLKGRVTRIAGPVRVLAGVGPR